MSNNNKNLIIFENKEFGKVRVQLDEQGEPLFCLKDLCEPLGLEAKEVRRRLKDKVVSTHPITDTLGRQREALFVTEAGMYKTVLQSRKPIAEDFQDWLCEDVIPSIRKTGTYSILDSYMIDDRVKRAERWIEEEQERIRLALQVEEMKPKVAYVDKVLESKDAMITTQIAKAYGLSARKFNELLNDLGVQYKANGQWVLYAEYQNLGYMSDETITYQKSNGEIGTKLVSKWTQKGRYFLYELLKDCNILPIK